ncbi:ABC transporter permease [Acinetobacter sp. MD2]|uniref:ABC transporter permease n=1 Tax=Acinetobacter sp. MD2 TaxID=2600066 RepID=UPI002D1F5D2B|nr:FtsX-like permease family protein [Acinetobacter sp. MD2]MEB3766235.1 FtsX-like permease family protein [Acinetobacter sp. MD2]
MTRILKPWLQQNFSNRSIWLLIMALSLAICATTALRLSNAQIQQALRLQAAQMLAADLTLTDQQPIAQRYRQQTKAFGLKTAQVTVFGTMAHTQQQFVMVTAKAIDEKFPLRGQLKISTGQRQISQGEVWLSPRAQDLLQVKVGDTVSIADAALKFTGVIERDLNQEMGFSGFAPMIIFSAQDLEKTHAIQTGSRIEYRLLMSGLPDQIRHYQQWFKQQYAQHSKLGNLQLRDAKQSNSRLVKPLNNLDLFLQLSNLITLLLCGIAIALASRRYVQQSQNQMALLRCLGASQSQLLTLLIYLLGGLILVSAVVGCIAGFGLGQLLLQLMLQMLPHLDLSNIALTMTINSVLSALGIGLLTSACVLIGFIAPNMYYLLKTAPMRVIRPDNVQQASMRAVWIFGLASLAVLSVVLTQNIILSLSFLTGVLVLGIVFWGLLWGILTGLKQCPHNWVSVIRLPIQMASYMTILALAMSLTAVLWVLKTDVLTRWQQQLPANTPNQFVYGLPPNDKAAFEQQLQQQHWSHTPLYPNIRARLVAKNGQPFSKQLIQQNNSLKRELNLTQAEDYPVDNLIVQGRRQLQHAGEVSVEAKTAQTLGIQIGDRLTFERADGNITATVINFRTVTWESFSPNFFFIFAPKTMDENAGSYLGSFYVPPQQNAALLAMIQRYNTTVFIDIGNILIQVKSLLSIAAQVIGILAVLVAVSGFLVLVACLNLLMDERKHEVALLRALGSSQQQIKRLFSLEFGLIGFGAGILACIFAESLSAIAAYQFNLAFQLHAQIWLILPIGMLLLCILIARFHFRAIYKISPFVALRD